MSSSVRNIVFAPVAVGRLAAIWPEARLVLADRLAQDLNQRVRGATGWVGESLPASDDAAWAQGRAGAAPAHLVVLTQLTALTELSPDGSARHRRVQATVQLLGLARDGSVVLRKIATGIGTDEGHAKLIGPANAPESRAVRAALALVGETLHSHLDHEPEAPPPATLPATNLLEIPVGSEPVQADIIVDGVFVGTTPQTLRLSPTGATIRLERAGFKNWERRVLPIPGMTVNPVLEKGP